MRYSRISFPYRLVLAAACFGLLSAFTYPFIQQGYEDLGKNTFHEAQIHLLEQSIVEYLKFAPSANWGSNTTTRQILEALSVGVDRDLSGRPQSLLPASEKIDVLEKRYRIIFRNSQNFKIVATGA
jgi:hypothetical protein